MSHETRDALPSLRKLQGTAAGLAGLGILAFLAVAFGMDQSAGKKVAWAGYLYGFTFWISLSLGCTTLTFLHHTIRAQWSLSILRVLEAGNRLLPVMFVLWIPLVVAVWTGNVYPWAHADAAHPLPHNKAIYLTPLAWTLRGVFYFAYWIFLTNLLNKSSLKQDDVRDEALAQRRTNISAPAGVIHVVLLTFAVTDWLMSLDPAWFSTLYGAWHMATQVLCTIAFGTFLTLSLRDRKPYSDIVQPALTKDLGNMMLGFTMVFGYFTLSQFLIIWSGNLPEEITFFVNRFEGPMVFVGAAIVAGQFLVPFLCLLAGKTKRTPSLLRLVALWVLVFRAIDLYWQVVPFLVNQSKGFNPVALAGGIAALLGVGGLWLYLFVNNLKRYALIPAHDPRLIEAKIKLEASSHA